MEKIYRGYKSKWQRYIEGYKKRINVRGYQQILDLKTNRWVTVDYIEEANHE